MAAIISSMARQEHDREDLMAEASALVERMELRLATADEPLVLGIRRGGCLSVYFTPDDAYHFNTRHELRRAYRQGHLLKAEHRRLVKLTRQRTGSEVQLLRHEMSAAEQQTVLDDLQRRLREVQQAAAEQRLHALRTVPEGLPALERVVQWLQPLAHVQVAAAPHAC